MNRLKLALIREYEDQENPPEFHNPQNTVTLELHFRGEKIAKVMGNLAITQPTAGLRLSGILVKRNFSYHLLAPSDLNKYTDMTMSTISQCLTVPFDGDFDKMLTAFQGYHLEQKTDCSVKVFDQIQATINVQKKFVVLDWISSPESDMYADTLIASLLKSSIKSEEMALLSNKTTMDVDTVSDDHSSKKFYPSTKTISSQAKELLFTNLLIDSLREMFSLQEEDFVVSTLKHDTKNDTHKVEKLLAFKIDNEAHVEINITSRQIIRCDLDHVRNMLNRFLSNSMEIGAN
ncbi:hypothetical protein BLA29_001169 [Euroglyphus maynei]|uniref:Pre-mRNA 3'-end-processing endonuclease polyadenylation factor C-term domain-containing protein n=1 Tax=Euroglyphus maynei TaxID=6958 RepID=A0A1Y3BFY8_EURMA|nr:hypothetical protein BLA29_001169 [Euroglyphus maynei]